MVLEGLDRRSLGQLPPVDGSLWRGRRRRRIFFFSLQDERDKGGNGRERGGDERRKGSVRHFSPKYRRVSGKFTRRGIRASFKNFSAVLQGVVADRMYLSDPVYSCQEIEIIRFPLSIEYFFLSQSLASKIYIYIKKHTNLHYLHYSLRVLNKINNLGTVLSL